MRKHIYRSMVWLTVCSVLLVFGIVSYWFYQKHIETTKQEIKRITKILALQPDHMFISEYEKTDPSLRITVLTVSGEVQYDTHGQLSENHANRREIQSLLSGQAAEVVRYSSTLNQEMYYYAHKTKDNRVLRVSKSIQLIQDVFIQSIQSLGLILLGLLFLVNRVASKLTGRLVKPINELSLSDEPDDIYEELSPFLNTISKQKREIELHIQEIQKRTETIQTLMNSMSEGIILLDNTGYVVSMNHSVKQFFNLEEKENRNIIELFREQAFLEQISKSFHGEGGEIVLERETKTYRVFFSPITHQGVLLLFLDISAQRKMELFRKEFSSTVSHELKTPLTSVYGNIELLANGFVKEEDKERMYQKIQNEMKRLIVLIQDLLLLSQLDERHSIQAIQSLSLNETVIEVIELLQDKLHHKNISIELNLAVTTISMNESHLRTILYNLIDNAISYNHQNGKIIVRIENQPSIRLSILDYGIGIAPQDQQRVFERFYRVDKSRSKKTGGSGLGLAIVKNLVYLYGGTIQLRSEEGQYTEVIILFSNDKKETNSSL